MTRIKDGHAMIFIMSTSENTYMNTDAMKMSALSVFPSNTNQVKSYLRIHQ